MVLFQISSDWTASSATTSSTGFLDMPKEIRDMIYGHICGDLKRKGLRWAATAPHTTKQPGDDNISKNAQYRINAPQSNGLSDQEASETASPSVLFADCAIMRTCHQLHAEFASVLYASPLQLSGISQGNNILPFSSTYAHLVRQVVSVETRFSYFNEVHEWRQKLQIAAGLSKIFSKARVIRLAWFVDRDSLMTSDAEKWKATVGEIQAMIKTVSKLSQVSRVVPWNLEIVQMRQLGSRWRSSTHYEEVESVRTPATEAIAGLRAKKPAKERGESKST
jgi:hypothetical protein